MLFNQALQKTDKAEFLRKVITAYLEKEVLNSISESIKAIKSGYYNDKQTGFWNSEMKKLNKIFGRLEKSM